ncbi:S1C family serine protease [Penaeicola halotolerans]|uniref:S1C family serine protease n=1 Tax=Penaeicola halotolerans TaxID=2793196 RepID=UPI001CF81003|nr:trypsin-like peptidase domain-containing protein [Penaeicola halotolerans]
MKGKIQVIMIAFVAGLAGASFWDWIKADEPILYQEVADSTQQGLYQMTNQPSRTVAVGEDFVEASRKSTSSVVFIKNFAGTDYNRYNLYDWFFNARPSQKVSSGSGVIFSKDGYIVTNNHVIKDAEVIEVIHEKRTYRARLVGTDPSTDLAVLKVEAENLPAIQIGSSSNLQIGEWVLAVGNPFNLTSTVTAGIVSAKERQINILQANFPLESFIQTDAAINPGNSGGALVNSRGELVGINTAILSQTGSYTGYGFAVPVDIVKKVVADIIRYGEVQKALIGAETVDLSQEIAEELKLNTLNGVVLSYIAPDGAAARAGLEKGDAIVSIDGQPIKSRGAFEEIISYKSPGDKLNLGYIRNGKRAETAATLLNINGETGVVQRKVYSSELLQATFESIPKVEKELYKIKSGVKVSQVGAQGFVRRMEIGEGYIITAINQKPVDDPEQLVKLLEKYTGRLLIEGITARGQRFYDVFNVQ